MKLIAHRGLLKGPDKELENRPDRINQALKFGYNCEIDVRYIDGKWMLGHDNPDYEVDYKFLEQPGLWIHAKNIDALYVLGADAKLNFFWHDKDDYTLTSQGYIWTYPNMTLTSNSIQVLPEWKDPEFKNMNWNCFGICTDFVFYVERAYIQAQRPKSE
jgi:hypothetical protein